MNEVIINRQDNTNSHFDSVTLEEQMSNTRMVLNNMDLEAVADEAIPYKEDLEEPKDISVLVLYDTTTAWHRSSRTVRTTSRGWYTI